MDLRRFLWKYIGKRRYIMVRFFWPCYYGFFLGDIGKRCEIERADTIANPERIFLGSDVRVGHSARIEAISTAGGAEYDSRISIGDGTYIGPYVHIGAAQSVTIGKHVAIGSRVYITDHDHVHEEPDLSILKQPLKSAPVQIGDFVWLGENVSVLRGVSIGHNAVVGANSVVTQKIPPFGVALGSPARVFYIQEDQSPRS